MNVGLFSIARSALLAQQRVLDTVSQNIANAETPGYSRQEDIVSATSPIQMPWGMMGTGVSAEAIVRKRDLLLDDQFRTASGDAARSGLRRDALTAMQNILGEPSDTGMSSAFDAFHNAWSDLAASPAGKAERAIVQQRGDHIAHLFNSYDAGLNVQRNANLGRLSNAVDEINGLASAVAKLNGQIKASEITGSQAADLRDQRDLLVDRLATRAGIRIIVQNDGTSTVIIGNSSLVDGVTARTLKLSLVPVTPPPQSPSPDIPVRISLGDSPDALKPLGGELNAMVQVLNTDIPGLRSRLDALASQFVATVNAAHNQGFVFSGSAIPGVAAGDFFNAGTSGAPVSAASIKLDAAIAADSNKIAASKDASAPLDNQLATIIAGFRNDDTTISYTASTGVETGSFLGFYRATATRLGLDVSSVSDDATVGETLAAQADSRRLSVSGVNTDEELIKMVRVQQAYVAATKLIKTADEMLQTLLSLV